MSVKKSNFKYDLTSKKVTSVMKKRNRKFAEIKRQQDLA